MGWVWDSTLEDAAAAAVLLYLANCGDDDGMNSFPSVKRIAIRARYSERTVKRVIAQLAMDGWISIVERGGGKGHTSAYEINVEKLQRCQRVTVVQRRQTVPRRAGIGATGARIGANGDNPPHPLIGRTVRETSGNRTPQPPAEQGVMRFPGGGVASPLDHAADQVCSALGISDERRRKRRMVHGAIARAAEKGELPATIALGMIAAVRKQAAEHEQGLLRGQYGLDKFLGDGIWREENRWLWDNDALRQRVHAAVGAYR